MISRARAAVSWSGGKDSCAAFERSRETFDIVAAVTMMDETGERSRSHGICSGLLRAQTAALGLTHVMRPCSWASYEQEFEHGLLDLRAQGVTHVICGDIVYPEHRTWAEQLAARAGLQAVEPLFGRSTTDVARSFVASGALATIVAVDASKLGSEWLGVELSTDAIDRLIALGVDPCGENGEYHTFVTNSPGFASPVPIQPGEVVQVRGYWAVDLALAATR